MAVCVWRGKIRGAAIQPGAMGRSASAAVRKWPGSEGSCSSPELGEESSKPYVFRSL